MLPSEKVGNRWTIVEFTRLMSSGLVELALCRIILCAKSTLEQDIILKVKLFNNELQQYIYPSSVYNKNSKLHIIPDSASLL